MFDIKYLISKANLLFIENIISRYFINIFSRDHEHCDESAEAEYGQNDGRPDGIFSEGEALVAHVEQGNHGATLLHPQ